LKAFAGGTSRRGVKWVPIQATQPFNSASDGTTLWRAKGGSGRLTKGRKPGQDHCARAGAPNARASLGLRHDCSDLVTSVSAGTRASCLLDLLKAFGRCRKQTPPLTGVNSETAPELAARTRCRPQSHRRPLRLAHVLSGLDVTDSGALSVDGQTPETRGENRSQAACRRVARLVG
jgi:hypothetical protein